MLTLSPLRLPPAVGDPASRKRSFLHPEVQWGVEMLFCGESQVGNERRCRELTFPLLHARRGNGCLSVRHALQETMNVIYLADSGVWPMDARCFSMRWSKAAMGGY